MIKFYLTSSLYNLLNSFLMGSMSWIWPVEKPMIRDTLSAVIVTVLKSWHVGLVPLYIFLSTGFVRSAACNNGFNNSVSISPIRSPLKLWHIWPLCCNIVWWTYCQWDTLCMVILGSILLNNLSKNTIRRHLYSLHLSLLNITLYTNIIEFR